MDVAIVVGLILLIGMGHTLLFISSESRLLRE